MGERKVLNRYIPADFDPAILTSREAKNKFKRDYTKLIEVRNMLPFSIRCNTCGEYLYMGKKFTMKMENVIGDDYMGIRKKRFYLKCSVCSAEITFKTDPKNSDYEVESGATRNFEIWRDTTEAKEEVEKEREEEEKMDSMKSLENRTLDSKLEMDVLDALDSIRAINQRHERVDIDVMLESRRKIEEKMADLVNNEMNDEELIKSIKFKSKATSQNHTLVDSDEEDKDVIGKLTASKASGIKDILTSQLKRKGSEIGSSTFDGKESSTAGSIALGSTIIVKKKKKIDSSQLSDVKNNHAPQEKSISSAQPISNENQSSTGLLGLGFAYGESDSD